MKPQHNNECKHNIYLGSNKKSDFYLYLNHRGSISICERFGEGGDYITTMFDNSLSNSNGHQLLEKLKEIINETIYG
jgi:hypothetical protein